ncbi:MAG TPA: hypothetical protein V6C89_01555 [Drouetiella sp.]|jgi:hypothetical protein
MRSLSISIDSFFDWLGCLVSIFILIGIVSAFCWFPVNSGSNDDIDNSLSMVEANNDCDVFYDSFRYRWRHRFD